jgi:transposase
MTRLRGRALRGRRLHAKAPAGHWNTTTMISSIRMDGSTACMAIDAATDAEVFGSYIQEVLLPTLRPGDILIMDNLSAHKDERTLRLLAQNAVRVLFLPPYSPDLNPIEKMWSKIKNRLRALEPRSQEQLHAAIATAFQEITEKDAISWFASCGYAFI